MKLEFEITDNGALAYYKKCKFIIFPKCIGFDWFIVYPWDNFYLRSDGRKFVDEIDCCGVTIEETVTHIEEFFSRVSPTREIECKLKENSDATKKKPRRSSNRRDWTTLFR